MRLRWWLPLTAAVFLYSLLMQAPAAVVYGWLVPPSAPLRVDGLTGTLGAGSASAVDLGGRRVLDELHWRLHPLWLLLGRLDVALHCSTGRAQAVGSAQWGLGGLRLRDVRADASLKDLLQLAGYSFIPAQGQIGLRLGRLQWSDGRLVALRGQLRIDALNWDLGSTPLALGSLTANLGTDGQGALTAKLSSLDGPLDVGGDARLAADGEYRVNLSIKPKPDAPPTLVGLLRGLGSPDLSGAYRLRRQGRLVAGLLP